MLRIFHSHYIYKLLLFLLILLGLVFSSFTSFAQCTVANNFISGSTNGLTITDVGQSFRMRVSGASCGNGEITSITIFNFSNN